MNLLRKFTLAALLLFPLMAFSQSSAEAKSIMEKCAGKIKKSGDMEVNFTATSFIDMNTKGSISGKIFLHGKKFNLVSTNVTGWFDGKTLWTLNKACDEVNVSTPSVRERQSMDPYLFVDLYKKGYNCTSKSTQLRGVDCHEVHLLSTNPKNTVKEMYVTIDKKTNMPLCIRMREGQKNWVRVSIKNCKVNQKYSDDKFTFNSKDYPQVTVVDIR